jgi:hypothetical protein
MSTPLPNGGSFRVPAPAAPQGLGGTGAPMTNPQGPGPSPFDPGAYSLGGMLDLLNNPGGHMSGGSAGTPGWTQSMAGARAASQQNYTLSAADAQKVYGQAAQLVSDRNPSIQSGYDAATAAIQANARARVIADQGAFGVQRQDQQNAINSLGLGGVGATGSMNRTANTLAANEGKYQQNADSWQGFNSAKSQSAIANNNAIADAIRYKGASQQNALQALLQQTVAKQQDIYHPGTAGKAGKIVGALSPMNQFAILKGVMGYGQNDFNNTLKTSKFDQATTQNTIKNTAAAAAAAPKNAINAAKAGLLAPKGGVVPGVR